MEESNENQYEQYVKPGFYIDSNHPAVVEYACKHTQKTNTPTENAIQLYYAIRDGFYYNPFVIDTRKEGLKASSLLKKNNGYCIEKAQLLAACARAVGIPARVGFARVKNHIGAERIFTLLKSDELIFHGYTELFLEGKWVKATPAFNKELCARYQVPPLEFDGKNDSLFQKFTAEGELFMEYTYEYGTFADFPRELFMSEMRAHYPHLFDHFFPEGTGKDDFLFDLNTMELQE